jgi:hypothetical protein
MSKVTRLWHKGIIEQAEAKLARPLTESEVDFITSRDAFLALELIEDKVKNLPSNQLDEYLNSES